MGRVVAMLKEVRDGTKGAVGVVHHTRKAGVRRVEVGACMPVLMWSLRLSGPLRNK
uniref:DNA encoding 14.5 kDa and 6 kDa proteins n=1 Tax=Salmonella typhimurium TaxID=90371 RepID=Q56082_SALTM|nr:unnamed protein product [Salmonella enterica subsp. enterica serovar Typhimurium]